MNWRVWTLAYGLAATIIWGPAVLGWIRWRLAPRRRAPMERTKGLDIHRKGPLDYKE